MPDAAYNPYSAAPVAFWPSTYMDTSYTVTPLGSDMAINENNQAVLQIVNRYGVQGAYDRNENGVDGTVPVTVRCVGRVTPAQLMPGIVANYYWSAQGGWGFMANYGNGNTVADEAGDNPVVVYQVDQKQINTGHGNGKGNNKSSVYVMSAARIVTDP